MTEEQLRLMARMLDMLSTDNPIVWSELVSHCRHCGTVGEKDGYQLRYEHTDDCLLALNAQLQASIKGQSSE